MSMVRCKKCRKEFDPTKNEYGSCRYHSSGDCYGELFHQRSPQGVGIRYDFRGVELETGGPDFVEEFVEERGNVPVDPMHASPLTEYGIAGTGWDAVHACCLRLVKPDYPDEISGEGCWMGRHSETDPCPTQSNVWRDWWENTNYIMPDVWLMSPLTNLEAAQEIADAYASGEYEKALLLEMSFNVHLGLKFYPVGSPMQNMWRKTRRGEIIPRMEIDTHSTGERGKAVRSAAFHIGREESAIARFVAGEMHRRYVNLPARRVMSIVQTEAIEIPESRVSQPGIYAPGVTQYPPVQQYQYPGLEPVPPLLEFPPPTPIVYPPRLKRVEPTPQYSWTSSEEDTFAAALIATFRAMGLAGPSRELISSKLKNRDGLHSTFRELKEGIAKNIFGDRNRIFSSFGLKAIPEVAAVFLDTLGIYNKMQALTDELFKAYQSNIKRMTELVIVVRDTYQGISRNLLETMEQHTSNYEAARKYLTSEAGEIVQPKPTGEILSNWDFIEAMKLPRSDARAYGFTTAGGKVPEFSIGFINDQIQEARGFESFLRNGLIDMDPSRISDIFIARPTWLHVFAGHRTENCFKRFEKTTEIKQDSKTAVALSDCVLGAIDLANVLTREGFIFYYNQLMRTANKDLELFGAANGVNVEFAIAVNEIALDLEIIFGVTRVNPALKTELFTRVYSDTNEQISARLDSIRKAAQEALNGSELVGVTTGMDPIFFATMYLLKRRFNEARDIACSAESDISTRVRAMRRAMQSRLEAIASHRLHFDNVSNAAK